MNEIDEVVEQEKKKSYAGVTKFMLIIRIAAAVYVLYLGYSLLVDYMAGAGLSLPILICVLCVFVLVSGFVLFRTIRALVRGEYAGGKADIDYFADVEEENVDVNMSLSDRLQKYNKENDENENSQENE